MRTHSHALDSLIVSRRRLLVDLGRMSLGVVVLGTTVIACNTIDGGDPPATEARSAANRWARVDLGFVSAYVVARDGELAVIDTGVAGSEDQIAAVLAELGGRWGDVGHVVLTHRHRDHAGSVEAVVQAATTAKVYAGAADVEAITSPRPITAAGDGDRVFGLRVIGTPGHTPGHISLLDPTSSVLFAGDAINGGGDGVVGPNPSFSDDMETAWESVRKLGELTFDTVVFGHGPPLEGGAAEKVAALKP